jgi:hypothetical protein
MNSGGEEDALQLGKALRRKNTGTPKRAVHISRKTWLNLNSVHDPVQKHAWTEASAKTAEVLLAGSESAH